MTFLETLQSHKGGLLRLKTELYWYGGRGYDRRLGRVCLLLDAAQVTIQHISTAAAATTVAAAAVAAARITALLLIDGSPQWVWLDEADVELL